MSRNAIEVGHRVRPRSGGPSMVVETVGEHWVRCVWTEEDCGMLRVRSGHFNPAGLVRVEPEQETGEPDRAPFSQRETDVIASLVPLSTPELRRIHVWLTAALEGA